MADSTHTATPSNDTESCSFQRTVTLYDWWLTKTKNDFQGNCLAIAGVSSRKDEALRVFVSAPVIKRYDVFSLETADGKCVIISGFINEQRTLENGFTPEVFNRFLFGFPPNWESYALDCFGEESTTGTDLGSAVPDNVSASCPAVLSEGVEKSIPTSLVSPEEAPGVHKKSFPENECYVPKEMGGVIVVCSGGGKRRSARLHDIKECQQKKQSSSGGLLKHLDNKENTTSVTVENSDVEGLKTLATPIHSQLWSEYSNDACVENSIPISLASPEEALGDHEKSFPENECNVLKEMGEVNVVCSGGGKRHSARLHDIKECQQKKQPSSGGLPKHADNENSTSVALDNCDVEGLKTPTTPIHSQLWNEYSNDACVDNSIPISLASPEEARGDHEESLPENEGNVSKMGGVNVVCSSGGKRRSARLHDIKVYQQKKQPSSGGLPKLPNNVNSTSVALDNCVEGLKSLATPIQSQSWRQLSTSTEQLVKKSASRISRTPKTEGCYKKKRVTVETNLVRPKGKLNKSASSVKNPQEKDLSHLTKGSQQKKSIVTPESLSFRKSKSGRLLLPPLEFWRNQIPIYNADHEITEIQDGASLISPCRGSSPSLSSPIKRKRERP